MGWSNSVWGTACPEFHRSSVSRRAALQVGALALSGLGLPDLLCAARRQETRSGWLWQCKVVHLDLYVGRAEPARYLGPQARRTRGYSRIIPTDRHERTGNLDQRALPVAGPTGTPPDDRPIDEPRRPGPPLDGPSTLDRAPGADALFGCRRSIAARLAAPGSTGRKAASDDGRGTQRGQHAVDGHASRGTRWPGAGPGRWLAGQGIRPVSGRRRSQYHRLPRGGARSSRGCLAAPAGLSSPAPGRSCRRPPTWPATGLGRGTATSEKHSTA